MHTATMNDSLRRSFAEIADTPLLDEILHRPHRPFFDIGHPGMAIAMSNRIITEETLNELIAGLRDLSVPVRIPVMTFAAGIRQGRRVEREVEDIRLEAVPGVNGAPHTVIEKKGSRIEVSYEPATEFMVGVSMLSMNDLDVQNKWRGVGIARARALDGDAFQARLAAALASPNKATSIRKRKNIEDISLELAYFVARCKKKWPTLSPPAWIRTLEAAELLPEVSLERPDGGSTGDEDEEELGSPIGEMATQTAEDVFLGGKEAPLPGGFTNTVQRAAEAPIGREAVRNFAKVGDERGFNPNKDTQPA